MKKHYLAVIFSGLAVGVIMGLLFVFGFFFDWRNRLSDKLFLSKNSGEVILIVSIDNQSLQALGRWPWDRKIHAELIEKISAAKPLVIGMDVNFPEASNLESDKALGEAIKKAGNVVLPVESDLAFNDGGMLGKNFLYPQEEIFRSAMAFGITNTPPDSDGVFRSLPLQIKDEQENEYEHFTKKIAGYYLAAKNISQPEPPLDNWGRLTVNYKGKPGTFKRISALDVIREPVNSELFKDKIVLIGATASDLHDEQITPVSRGVPMSGVEVLANGINTLVSGDYLDKVSKATQFLFIIVASLIVALMIAMIRIGIASIATLFILVAYFIFSLLMFNRGKVFDLFFVGVAIFISYLSALAVRYYFETKEKKYIKNTFSYYVSKDIINDLLANPDKIKLGGEEKEMTILFSDIRSFTTISEKLSPHELVELLNNYLTAMSQLIMKRRGVVDKYIGDAIMAFWGAPLEVSNHSALACQSALEMIRCLKEKKPVWQAKYGVDLNIGVGVNTGRVVVGNMGSEQRFDYTVMGDAVNLASRLESITKIYGVPIVTSEFTYGKTKDQFVWRYLDKVAVKGKKVGVKIYELVSELEELDEQKKKMLGAFSTAVDYYQKRQWSEAIFELEKILGEFPLDIPSQLYLERSREFSKIPPPGDWDGIYIMKTK
jgi:adenylate cyclase